MSDADPTLVDKVIALDDALRSLGISHAFGGALALAYYTLEPRTTADIDVNVSVTIEEAERVFSALPDGIRWTTADLERVRADDQVRLWWGRTPVDLFFRASEFHDGVATRAVPQPFGSRRLPFLSAEDLAVFKSLFDRPKDWLDIAAMYEADAIDIASVAEVLRSLLGDDQRVDRLRAIDGSG